MLGGGGGLFALHGSVNHLEEVALHRSVLYRLCVGGGGGGLFALHGSVNHLEEVALHRSVLYRLCVWVGWGTVCTAWFGAVLIIWRGLPYTGQCCINCVCVCVWGGGGTVCTTCADHLEVALHRSVLYRLWGGGGGMGGLMVHAMLIIWSTDHWGGGGGGYNRTLVHDEQIAPSGHLSSEQ